MRSVRRTACLRLHAAEPFRLHSSLELRSRLETSGALPRLRAGLLADIAAVAAQGAEVRASTCRASRGNASTALSLTPTVCQPPPAAGMPDENLVINELIREYLLFNRYTSCLSVLLAETGASGTTALTRPELAALTGVVDDVHSRRLPLLYELVEKSKKQRKGE